MSKDGLSDLKDFEMEMPSENSKPKAVPQNMEQYINVGGRTYRIIGSEVLPWPRQDIIDVHGKDVLKQLERYYKFALIPEHINFKKRIKSSNGIEYNRYHKLSHNVSQGSWDNIETSLRHIFGDQYEMALEWLWLIYTHPKKLAIAWVLKGPRRSGKTSFLDLLDDIFQNNYASIDPGDLIKDANAHYAGKLVVAVDEKIQGREAEKELQAIKRAMSQRHVILKELFRDKVMMPNYMKFVFCTNSKVAPIKLELENHRIMVIDVPVIKKPDHLIKQRMTDEVPAFLYFLQNEFEPKLGDHKERFWFPPEMLGNKATKDTQEDSMSECAVWLKDMILNKFNDDVPDGTTSIWASNSDISHESNGRYSAKYIKKVLEEELDLGDSVFKRYTKYIGDISKNNSGRNYVKRFDKSDFCPE